MRPRFTRAFVALASCTFVAAVLFVTRLAFAAAEADGQVATVEAVPGGEAPSPGARGVQLRREAEARIYTALDEPLKSPLQYLETPLNQITAELSADYGIPVVFDKAALESLAISPEVEVSVDLSNITLRSALELLLRDVEDLTYIVDREVLLITSEDEANSQLITRVYPVADLIDGRPGESSLDPSKTDFEALIDVLVASVDHDSWMENGTGEGEMVPLAPGMLVVTQTQPVHEQLAELLEEIRAQRPSMANTAAGGAAATEAYVARGFKIGLPDLAKVDGARAAIERALVVSVGQKSGQDDAGQYLRVVGDRVLVRDTATVVRKVERAIHDLGLASKPKTQPTAFGGGGGFGGGGRGGGNQPRQNRGGF